MPEIIVPYEGGTVRVSEQAQAAAKAAQEWAVADPGFTRAKVKGVQELDQESAQARLEIMRQMRTTPPKPATIINLHPWPLTFGATSRLLRGITVPACELDMPLAYHHVRGYRLDWEYNENGTFKFKPILPIEMAAQFIREFSNKDAYGGGVIIYEGDLHPDKMDLVEVYDPIGRPQTTETRGFEYGEENEKIPTLLQTPVKRKLLGLIEEHTKQRNAAYLARVRKADHDYKLPDGRGKWLINDTHLLMAQVLFSQGIIQKLPEWNLSDRMEAGLAEHNCPACMASPKEGAFACSACGHILKALEAYRAGAIQWGHASMETMSSDELDEAEEIRTEREANRLRLAGPVTEAKPKAEKKGAAARDKNGKFVPKADTEGDEGAE
jgi:hypothetical protein